jgi:hypothetical protein
MSVGGKGFDSLRHIMFSTWSLGLIVRLVRERTKLLADCVLKVGFWMH